MLSVAPLFIPEKVAWPKTIKLVLFASPVGAILVNINLLNEIHKVQNCFEAVNLSNTGFGQQYTEQEDGKMTGMTAGKNRSLALREVDKVRWITVTAVFMGMNIALCAFGVPVPGGHLYLNDVVICTASLLLDPVGAFICGGIGAFLGDFIFYPLPMFVSLLTHGLQAVVISLLFRNLFPRHRRLSATIAVLVGAVIMVTGYTLGKIYVYSTFEYAMVKLPYEIAQALLGVAGSLLLCFRGGLIDSFNRILRQ